MLILIEQAEVYAPEPQGRQSLLLAFDKIAQIGAIDRRNTELIDPALEVIDASGCIVVPGFIDPHEHLLGGSGEEGFSTQTPAIALSEIVSAGITTVVGLLGVDTTMKTMAGMLARVKALKEEGLNAYAWSGGYTLPPTTVTQSIRNDIMFIEEIIGLGELAIADPRASDPNAHELARAVTDAHVGGMLSHKAGRTHFHVGAGGMRLSLLRELLNNDHYEIEPDWLYPTHVERSEALMDEAIALAKRGAFVDIDTVEQDTPKWLAYYTAHDGDLDRLTFSSDASLSSPRTLLEQVRECACKRVLPLEQLLPLVTANTAHALSLSHKGRLVAGMQADVVILERETLDIRHVLSNGRWMVRDGVVTVREAYLKDSNRRLSLQGERH